MAETQMLADTPDFSQAIGLLARDLRPVRRLAPTWQRAGLWLAAAAWLAVLLSFFTDFPALRGRLSGAPDMWMSETGAALTATLAGWAALQTSIPGRSAAWAWAPVPALALWIGAGTAGCLRPWAVAAAQPETPMHPLQCLGFLVLVSLPLYLLLGWFLLRAYPLRPGLTASLAGLASAAAAATLLAMIHPFDANAEDLAAHLAAVLAIIAAARRFGPYWINAANSPQDSATAKEKFFASFFRKKKTLP